MAIGLAGWSGEKTDPVDEAKAASKTTADFPTHSHNNYKAMDYVRYRHMKAPGPVKLTKDEVKGRNTWMMWTGGNQAFWDHVARHGTGFIDLLKLLDNRFVAREDRFRRMGLIPTPGMNRPTEPGKYGLWLDIEGSNYSYSKKQKPDPEVYGYPSGIVGLRIFKNPNFDEKAEKAWNAKKYI